MKTIILIFLFITPFFISNENISEATYYCCEFNGRKTASGEIFNEKKFTAAHKTAKLGSYLLITNIKNGKQVVVKVNDRLPKTQKADIDLSKSAFEKISKLENGRIKVIIQDANKIINKNPF